MDMDRRGLDEQPTHKVSAAYDLPNIGSNYRVKACLASKFIGHYAFHRLMLDHL